MSDQARSGFRGSFSGGTSRKRFEKSYKQGELKEPEAEKLLDAINHEDEGQVDALLTSASSPEKIARLKAININGGSFLHYAAAKKSTAIVERIIQAGFPVSQPARRPMEIYMETYHTISTFRAHSTPLYIAVVSGNKAIVECFLRQGADPNLADAEGNVPLHNAAWNNRTAIMSLLLSHGALTDMKDRTGSTPLRKAAYRGHVESVSILVKAGANANIKTKKGRTALHAASLYGHTDVVSVLVSMGPEKCDIDAIDNDHITPLHAAVYGGKRLVASGLIRAGASVHSQTKLGNTPLHLACMEKWFVIAHTLVKEGASQETVNRFHETPLDVLDAESRKTILSVVNAPTIKELEQLEKDDHRLTSSPSLEPPAGAGGMSVSAVVTDAMESFSSGQHASMTQKNGPPPAAYPRV